MDLEETKKIIRNKITADEAAREVRSQIKSYIHEKQNAREGFTETFKPLIETSEKVKESIDTQQNKLIEQLQKNQLALTEGLNKNRLAVTSGFDKMDEVKKWDLQQLPGFEATLDAVEEPEKKDEGEEDKEDIIQKLNKRIENKIVNMEKLNISAKKANKEENFALAQYYLVKIKEEKDNIEEIQNEINRLQQTLEEESFKKPKITTVTYEKDEMDKYLNNKESIDLLNFYGLKLPSEYKDKSLEELQKAFEKGMNETANLKKSI